MDMKLTSATYAPYKIRENTLCFKIPYNNKGCYDGNDLSISKNAYANCKLIF